MANINIQDLVVNFNEFNCKYFNNELSTPQFLFNRAKRTLGLCQRITNNFGIAIRYRICISKFYDRTLHDYCNTLLHEMIHLYIFQKNIIDNDSHGRVFCSIADRINKDGWRITKVEEAVSLIPSKEHIYHIVILQNKLDNNKYFACSVASNRVYDYISYFKNHQKYKLFRAFKTNSKQFAHYITCRNSLKGRYLNEDMLPDLTQNCIENYQY